MSPEQWLRKCVRERAYVWEAGRGAREAERRRRLVEDCDKCQGRGKLLEHYVCSQGYDGSYWVGCLRCGGTGKRGQVPQ